MDWTSAMILGLSFELAGDPVDVVPALGDGERDELLVAGSAILAMTASGSSGA